MCHFLFCLDAAVVIHVICINIWHPILMHETTSVLRGDATVPWSPPQTLKIKKCKAKPSSSSERKTGFSRVFGIRPRFAVQGMSLTLLKLRDNLKRIRSLKHCCKFLQRCQLQQQQANGHLAP